MVETVSYSALYTTFWLLSASACSRHGRILATDVIDGHSANPITTHAGQSEVVRMSRGSLRGENGRRRRRKQSLLTYIKSPESFAPSEDRN
jgi:hypothetical protein